MARYEGANADIGMVVESTYGTAVSPRTGWIAAASYALVQTPKYARPRTLLQRHRFGKTASVFLGEENSLSLEGELQYDFVGPIIRAALGTSSSSGAGPFDHTYANSYPLPSYTFEADLGDGANSRVANGCVCDALTITVKPGELVSYKSDWLVRQVVAPASQGSPTYSATRPVVRAEDAAATWNGITLSTELLATTFEIKNGLTRQYVTGGGGLTTIPHTSGERMATIKLDLQYGSVIANAFQTAALARTAADFVMTITSGANVMVLTGRNAEVDGDSIPKVTGADAMTYSVTLTCVADDSNDAFDVVVTNSSASDVANA